MGSNVLENISQILSFLKIEKLHSLLCDAQEMEAENEELRHAVESEQLAEKGRAELLAQTAEGSDKVRLQKLLKLKRKMHMMLF